jgi:hypothetical protein
MASAKEYRRGYPRVYLVVPERAVMEMAAEPIGEPLGPLAEPEPIIASEAASVVSYSPQAHHRRLRYTRGFFLDRYA